MSGEWYISLPKPEVASVRGDRAFHLYLLAAKMSESLKFGVSAMLTVATDESHSGDRQRMWALMYQCAAINEIRDWAKTADRAALDHPVIAAGLAGMASVPKNPNYEAALGRLRNQVVFHHDLEALARITKKLPSQHINVAQGAGRTPLSSTWDLVQLSILAFGLGLEGNLAALPKQVLSLLHYADDLAKGFVLATEAALLAHRSTFRLILAEGPAPS